MTTVAYMQSLLKVEKDWFDFGGGQEFVVHETGEIEIYDATSQKKVIHSF